MSWKPIYKTRGLVVTEETEGAWILRDAEAQRTESGPDRLSLTYEGFFDLAPTRFPSLANYDRGALPKDYEGEGNWRVTGARPRRKYGPFWTLEVECQGAISPQEKKVRWITGADQFSAEKINVAGLGIVDRLSSRQPLVGVEYSYLVFGTKPTSPQVPEMVNPPEPRPPVPINMWDSVSAEIAVIHHPSGWVREAFDPAQIVPGLWWVTERFVYVFPITGG